MYVCGCHNDRIECHINTCIAMWCGVQMVIGFKWSTSQMADRILKFIIGHLGPGSNVQLGLVDFKVLQSANRNRF